MAGVGEASCRLFSGLPLRPPASPSDRPAGGGGARAGRPTRPLEEGGRAASPPYRDLGEDVDEQVEHSQGDRDSVAAKAFP